MRAIALLAIMVAALNFAACSTTREQRCEYYSAAYTAYLVSVAARPNDISEDERNAARIAAHYLSAYCGWETIRGTKEVPLVVPPGH